MKTNQQFPIVDRPTVAELQRLNVTGRIPNRRIVAAFTGEVRPPKRGEWYLSGAIVEGYKAPNDLSTPYHIAKLTLSA